MAAFQISPPSSFDFTKPEEWPRWVRRFDRFRISSGLDEQPVENQVNTLIYTMGDQADDILSTWSDMTDDHKKDYGKVKARFEKQFVSRETQSSRGQNSISASKMRPNLPMPSSQLFTHWLSIVAMVHFTTK